MWAVPGRPTCWGDSPRQREVTGQASMGTEATMQAGMGLDQAKKRALCQAAGHLHGGRSRYLDTNIKPDTPTSPARTRCCQHHLAALPTLHPRPSLPMALWPALTTAHDQRQSTASLLHPSCPTSPPTDQHLHGSNLQPNDVGPTTPSSPPNPKP